ncbi:TPA: hypothetical protein QB430_001870 [Pasteurella multocida]|nr:hypothetical protein [Pasteurella multocida]
MNAILNTNAQAIKGTFNGSLEGALVVKATKKGASMFRRDETVYTFLFTLVSSGEEYILFAVECYTANLSDAENQGVRKFKEAVLKKITDFNNVSDKITVAEGETFAIEGWEAFNEAVPYETQPKYWDGKKWVDGVAPVKAKWEKDYDAPAFWLTAENVVGL